MKPGEHIVIVGGPSEALRARSEGFQVRDTLLVLLPGGRVLTAFLCRWPLEGTVAENVLKHGVGGLWIDGCRVGTSEALASRTHGHRPRAMNPGGGCRAAAPGDFEQHPSGRWPTNLLLVHGAGCRRVGDKRVKASNQPGSVGGLRHSHTYAQDSYSKKYERTERQCYADPDGLETVLDWECQPDCPVRMLDEQSGDRVSGHLRAEVQRAAFGQNGVYSKASGTGLGRTYEANAGGASRFYPQFQSLTEALAWLARLIGGPL